MSTRNKKKKNHNNFITYMGQLYENVHYYVITIGQCRENSMFTATDRKIVI